MRGTLLLDEIAEFSLTAQPKLLRILETREVNRMGGRASIPVDFRLIVSTNCDLKEMIRSNKFRDDLYDRLDQDTIRTPPLRERLDDIPFLCEYFIGEYVPEARRPVTGVSTQVLNLFRKHSWPGNIRELENIIRRAVFKGRSEEIRLEDLPFDFAQQAVMATVKLGNHDRLLSEYSKQLCVEALKQAGGNRTKARQLLGLSRMRFYRLAKAHGLDAGAPNNGQQTDENDEESEWLQ